MLTVYGTLKPCLELYLVWCVGSGPLKANNFAIYAENDTSKAYLINVRLNGKHTIKSYR
jgi:hypothetical protein